MSLPHYELESDTISASTVLRIVAKLAANGPSMVKGWRIKPLAWRIDKDGNEVYSDHAKEMFFMGRPAYISNIDWPDGVVGYALDSDSQPIIEIRGNANMLRVA